MSAEIHEMLEKLVDLQGFKDRIEALESRVEFLEVGADLDPDEDQDLEGFLGGVGEEDEIEDHNEDYEREAGTSGVDIGGEA